MELGGSFDYGARMTASSASRAAPHAKYAKSAETQRAILDAAIHAFGKDGFEATSTRAIAAIAGVNQPAINYHFGSKDALYLACAHAIVEDFARGTGKSSLAAAQFLADTRDRAAAVSHLKAVMHELVELLAGSREASVRSAFVLREMHSPGEAYTILYESIWAPGIKLVADLLDAARGNAQPSDEAKLQAIMLISSLVAFTSGRQVSKAVMQWDEIGDTERAQVHKLTEQQIDALVASGQQG